jgi:branched-chain amino acid transport system permease protein
VRYLAFMIAGFFAGVAGGLHAINFEIVTAEVVGAPRSGAYLLFTFLGGASFFFGPILGAVLLVFATVMLSEMTKAWLLYLGLVFLLMVMFAPGGLASLIMMNVRVAAHGLLRRLYLPYLGLALAGLVVVVSASLMVEMVYHIKLNEALGPLMKYAGVEVNTHSQQTWGVVVVALALGAGGFEAMRRHFSRVWGGVQSDIEARLAKGQA